MFFIRLNNKKSDPINTIVSLIMLVVVFMLIFFVARGIFRILTWMAPFLFIATLILDYRVILSYGKYLLRTLERNVIWGIVMSVLTVIGFPLVIAFLFGKALLFRRVKSVEKEIEGKKADEYIPYEEVDEDEDEFLDLPEFKDKEKDRDRYGRFFD